MQDNSGAVPLFSTPVYHTEDTGFRCSEKELESIDRLNYFPSAASSCLLSKNQYIFKLNYFSRIKKECEKYLKIYTKDVLSIKQDFYITNSWITKKSISSGYRRHHTHNHPNSIFSGVLYLKVEDGSDQKLWLKGNSGHLDGFGFEYHYNDLNIYNATQWWIPVNVGTCIIFPSHISHRVDEIETGGERIVVGFNCFVKGKFGGEAYASDILL